MFRRIKPIWGTKTKQKEKWQMIINHFLMSSSTHLFFFFFFFFASMKRLSCLFCSFFCSHLFHVSLESFFSLLLPGIWDKKKQNWSIFEAFEHEIFSLFFVKGKVFYGSIMKTKLKGGRGGGKGENDVPFVFFYIIYLI